MLTMMMLGIILGNNRSSKTLYAEAAYVFALLSKNYLLKMPLRIFQHRVEDFQNRFQEAAQSSIFFSKI